MKKTALFLCLFLGLFAPVLRAADVYTVSRVSDGDTLVLSDGQKVRLIGVDTPEMEDEARNRRNAAYNRISAGVVNDFAFKAKQYVREQVEGRPVRLEYDWQRQDKYGRTLAYVYRQPEGTFLNAEILRQGYGFAYLRFPFKYSEQFRVYAQEAREAKRGLWK